MRSRLDKTKMNVVSSVCSRYLYQSKQFVLKTPFWSVTISSEGESHIVKPNLSTLSTMLFIRLREMVRKTIKSGRSRTTQT